MAETLKLDILTPQGRLSVDEGPAGEPIEVGGVEVPGLLGELGILPRHIPFVSPIVPGVVRFRAGGKDLRVAVGKGFVEVHGDMVSILADRVMRSEDVAVDEVRGELARVREELGAERGSVEHPRHVALSEQRAWLDAQLRATGAGS